MPSPWEMLRRYPLLRRLFVGSLVSGFGDSLTWMALLWYVVELTGNGGAVGTLLLCFALPALVTGAPLGRLLDRLSARDLMLADNVLRAFFIALAPLLAHFHALTLPLLYGIAAVSGALAPATRAGLRLLVPRIVPDAELEAANGALGWTDHLPGVLGPPVAGVLIATAGALGALWLDALSFLVMAGALLGVPKFRPESGSERHGTTASPLILAKYPPVLVVTALTAAFSFAYGPTEAALPLFVKGPLRADARGLGLLWGALGVGAVTGNAFVGAIAARAATGGALALIALLWGVFQAFVPLTHSVWLAALFFFLGGIAWGPYMALEATFLQRQTPADRHGAIFGAHAALLAPMMPLGTALGGVVLRTLSPGHVILGSAVACMVAALFGFLLLNRRSDGGEGERGESG